MKVLQKSILFYVLAVSFLILAMLDNVDSKTGKAGKMVKSLGKNYIAHKAAKRTFSIFSILLTVIGVIVGVGALIGAFVYVRRLLQRRDGESHGLLHNDP